MQHADIILPAGWNWERVTAERIKWGMSDDMVPCATVAHTSIMGTRVAGGVTAWGTINSVRRGQAMNRAEEAGKAYFLDQPAADYATAECVARNKFASVLEQNCFVAGWNQSFWQNEKIERALRSIEEALAAAQSESA